MRNIPPRYGIDMTEKLHTLAYFSRSAASELGGSCHVELGGIFATALHGPYGSVCSDVFAGNQVDLTQRERAFVRE
jgi:hypothetical protein